jgi:cytochrome c oxidase subunit 2
VISLGSSNATVNNCIDMAPVVEPASRHAEAIYGLYLTTLVVCGIILVVVVFMVAFALIRYRRREGAGEPTPSFGHRNLEIVWTLVPLLLVSWLFFLTVRGMQLSDPGVGEEPDIVVTAHQFWWEFSYPKTGVVTANELHIPAGVNLQVKLVSADVIHDFWVPRLARKMDCIPGLSNHIWLEADRPGTYQGFCSHYCGAQHAGMRFLVIAQSSDDYKAWEQRQLKPAPRPATSGAIRGARLFRELTCVTCHVRKGEGFSVAPDLSHLAGRRTLAAGLLANNPENLAKWISDPQTVKPKCLMPNLDLTLSQVDDLVAYLEVSP